MIIREDKEWNENRTRSASREIPYKPDFFFSGFLFANVTATQVNCDDLLSFACIYIHNFI